jgi:hypothetical protein
LVPVANRLEFDAEGEASLGAAYSVLTGIGPAGPCRSTALLKALYVIAGQKYRKTNVPSPHTMTATTMNVISWLPPAEKYL